MGHARALLTLAPQAAVALARQAAEHEWSVREVEHRVQQLMAGQVANGTSTRKAKPAKAKPQADIATLERELSESLGTRVNVLHGRARQGPAGDPLLRPGLAGRRARTAARQGRVSCRNDVRPSARPRG